MALIYMVGDIVGQHREEHVEWKISDYFSQPQKADSIFESPPFYIFGAKWCILFYPNGTRSEQTTGMINMHLKVQNLFPYHPVTFTLGIKDLPRRLKSGPLTQTYTFSKLNPSAGWTNIMRRNDLIWTMKEDLHRSTLTVYCNISTNLSSVKDAACQTLLDSTTYLRRDFQDLLESGRKSDLTIEVCGQVFKVHKLILEARSPVFLTMFEHTMKEKIDIIKIDDCDPNAFQDFLQYMYTGNIENLSWDNVIHLFTTAVKYSVKELKEQCSEFMTKNLSLESACDILEFYEKHEDLKITFTAIMLLMENMSTFKNTEKWQLFMEKNPSMALKILMLCVPNKCSATKDQCCIL